VCYPTTTVGLNFGEKRNRELRNIVRVLKHCYLICGLYNYCEENKNTLPRSCLHDTTEWLPQYSSSGHPWCIRVKQMKVTYTWHALNALFVKLLSRSIDQHLTWMSSLSADQVYIPITDHSMDKTLSIPWQIPWSSWQWLSQCPTNLKYIAASYY